MDTANAGARIRSRRLEQLFVLRGKSAFRPLMHDRVAQAIQPWYVTE